MIQETIQLVNKHLQGVELKSFTEEQKVLFANNYNCKLYFFEYGLSLSGDLVVNTTKNNYHNLLYYMGFDSNSNYIKLKIESDENVLVVYDTEHQRVAHMAQKLGLVS